MIIADNSTNESTYQQEGFTSYQEKISFTPQKGTGLRLGHMCSVWVMTDLGFWGEQMRGGPGHLQLQVLSDMKAPPEEAPQDPQGALLFPFLHVRGSWSAGCVPRIQTFSTSCFHRNLLLQIPTQLCHTGKLSMTHGAWTRSQTVCKAGKPQGSLLPTGLRVCTTG